MLRRLLVCLGFATCCFLNTWVELAEGKAVHFARYDPVYTVAVPVIYWEVILTLGILGIWEFLRRRPLLPPQLLRVLFLVSCFVPLGIASIALFDISPVNLTPIVRSPLFLPAVCILVPTTLGFAGLYLRGASRLMQGIFLYSGPVLAIVLFQAASSTLFHYPSTAYADGLPAPALHVSPPRIRVIWVIFDELSQAIAFSHRPAGLELPNLDRLRQESFYATAAAAPGRSTEISMPSLVLGEMVTKAVPQGPRDLLLRTRSRPQPFSWGSVPNVFDTARQMGFNTALVGWFHPYGRLLNRSLTTCYWTAGWLLSGIEEPFQPQSLVGAMRDRVALQFAAFPLVGHLPGVFPGVYHRKEKLQRVAAQSTRARAVAADSTIGLALFHLAIPHPPPIYSRAAGTLTSVGHIGYLDNVALADRILGMLRRTMEEAGLWERTALLISADHGWRTEIWRGDPEWTPAEEAASHHDTSGVPFLLKLPGKAGAVCYGKPFNTVVTRRLITEILQGSLTEPSQVPVFIEQHGFTP